MFCIQIVFGVDDGSSGGGALVAMEEIFWNEFNSMSFVLWCFFCLFNHLNHHFVSLYWMEIDLNIVSYWIFVTMLLNQMQCYLYGTKAVTTPVICRMCGMYLIEGKS